MRNCCMKIRSAAPLSLCFALLPKIHAGRGAAAVGRGTEWGLVVAAMLSHKSQIRLRERIPANQLSLVIREGLLPRQ